MYTKEASFANETYFAVVNKWPKEQISNICLLAIILHKYWCNTYINTSDNKIQVHILVIFSAISAI